jgi:hypothetical protein
MSPSGSPIVGVVNILQVEVEEIQNVRICGGRVECDLVVHGQSVEAAARNMRDKARAFFGKVFQDTAGEWWREDQITFVEQRGG